jgi:hypothetical protein
MDIEAMQNVTAELGSAVVIQGFGQTSGSKDGASWTQTNIGVLIASGTYSESGTLSVSVAAGAYVQVLNIVSNGQWSGPGNISDAAVTGDTITV